MLAFWQNVLLESLNPVLTIISFKVCHKSQKFRPKVQKWRKILSIVQETVFNHISSRDPECIYGNPPKKFGQILENLWLKVRRWWKKNTSDTNFSMTVWTRTVQFWQSSWRIAAKVWFYSLSVQNRLKIFMFLKKPGFPNSVYKDAWNDFLTTLLKFFRRNSKSCHSRSANHKTKYRLLSKVCCLSKFSFGDV